MGLSSWLNSKGQGVKKVLELGSGPCSTSLFLSRTSFPHLEQLVSMESSTTWAMVMMTLYGTDSRITMRVHEDEDVLLRDSLEYAPYDIALVDGATNSHRIKAIPQCLEMAKFVVLHDVQEPDLKPALSLAPHVVLSVIESPWTAVMSLHEAPFGYSA